MKVDKKIKVKKKKWTFSNSVYKHFDKHVLKSVPFYNEGHDLILDLSDFFLKNNSICYDIGCSTGILLKKISKKINYFKDLRLIGLDNQKNMIKFANRNNNSKKLSFKCRNILDYNFKKSDMIISYYTIQFIHPSLRQKLFSKLYKSLNWGGCLVLFEKVRGKDARFQDIMTGIYNEFKIRNGFLPEEIFNKTRSLKGILEPFSTNGNLDLLKRAGFLDIEVLMKYNCFEGYLAIK